MPRFEMMRQQHWLTYVIWAMLIGSAGAAVALGRWGVAFVSVSVFGLTLLPLLVQRWAKIVMPRGFVACVVAFIAGTLFLGEVGDFYERFWWWDTALHSGSAVGFGMIGMILVLYMLQGHELTAPPYVASLFAFTFAVAIGALWEVFEFAMDLAFRMNMQKSGLRDTMGDLIVDCFGAAVGALAGLRYLRGHGSGRLTRAIRWFIETNFRKS